LEREFQINIENKERQEKDYGEEYQSKSKKNNI
jgi:hypothetical protein